MEARGACVANRLLDEARAEVTFDDGFTAALSASRVAQGRERTMRLVYPAGVVAIDFLSHVFENTTPFALNRGYEETPAGADRLGASLQAFVDAVRGAAPAPLADAADGARALDLALAVEQAVAEGHGRPPRGPPPSKGGQDRPRKPPHPPPPPPRVEKRKTTPPPPTPPPKGWEVIRFCRATTPPQGSPKTRLSCPSGGLGC